MAFLHPNPGTEISNLKVTNAESFRNDAIINLVGLSTWKRLNR
jgi:hypothetical protein